MGLRRPSRYSAVGLSRPVVSAGTLAMGLAAGGAAAAWWCARHLGRVVVSGSSMEPALQAGDRLLVWKTASLRPGDVVAAYDPRHSDRAIVKRAADIRDGEVWLEGDNPGHSTDSRHFGAVPMALVEGRAIYRYGPPERAGRLHGKDADIRSERAAASPSGTARA